MRIWRVQAKRWAVRFKPLTGGSEQGPSARERLVKEQALRLRSCQDKSSADGDSAEIPDWDEGGNESQRQGCLVAELLIGTYGNLSLSLLRSGLASEIGYGPESRNVPYAGRA